MKITSKGEYAAKAVLYLSVKHPQVVTIQEIAAQQKLPLKYLERILLMLKNAGVLSSRRGIKGGYQLARPPHAITVGEILSIMDGNFAHSTSDDPALGLLWVEVQAAVEGILNRTTFEDMRRRAEPLKAAGA